MIATSILPSIKISKSGGPRSPVQNNSELFLGDEIGLENERPATSGNDGKRPVEENRNQNQKLVRLRSKC